MCNQDAFPKPETPKPEPLHLGSPDPSRSMLPDLATVPDSSTHTLQGVGTHCRQTARQREGGRSLVKKNMRLRQ